MKILVIGAHGRVGSIIAEKLKDNDNHEVVAGLRKEEQIEEYQKQGYETALIDLEGELTDIEDKMEGIDAIVFSAGSGDKTGADKTMMVDLDGTAKSIIAAENKDIKRFVMISAYGADDREFWSYGRQDLSPTGNYYFAAKYYGDLFLRKSSLDYTVLRPTLLLDDAGNGTVTLAESIKDLGTDMKIPREDVAETAIASLENDNTIGKSFDLDAGTTDITEAVKSILGFDWV